jgi:adenine phosphoribosyltransferase
MSEPNSVQKMKGLIRDIPDYPKPGIVFKDITPVLLDAQVMKEVVQGMAAPFREASIDLVLGAEARGFLFGPAIALELGAGFMPIRKPGKLPGSTIQEEYTLEYGTDALEIHTGQMPKGATVLLVDDVLATGGTMEASKKLVEKEGGLVAGFSFLIELSFLGGRKKLPEESIYSLLEY